MNVDSIENIVLNNVWVTEGVNGFGCVKIGVFWRKRYPVKLDVLPH